MDVESHARLPACGENPPGARTNRKSKRGRLDDVLHDAAASWVGVYAAVVDRIDALVCVSILPLPCTGVSAGMICCRSRNGWGCKTIKSLRTMHRMADRSSAHFGTPATTAALAVPGTVLMGISLAIVLMQLRRAAGFWRALVYMPSVLPTVATAVSLDVDSGTHVKDLINEWLTWMGMPPSNWFRGTEEGFLPSTWVEEGALFRIKRCPRTDDPLGEW